MNLIAPLLALCDIIGEIFKPNKKEKITWLTRLMLLHALDAVAARILALRKLSSLAMHILSMQKSALIAVLAHPPARLVLSPRRD